MSPFNIAEDTENENSDQRCFPNNKTIKCFMKRTSRVALKPINGQRIKKQKVDESSKKKESNVEVRLMIK